LTESGLVPVIAGIVLAVWLGIAAWAVVTGLAMRRRARHAGIQANRLQQLLDSAPALPMMVRPDGRIEAPERLADWLGLARIPNFLADLTTPDGGLIACSWHGAVFTVEEGACVGGPCVGAKLSPWPVEAREGRIVTA